jgi:multicomponent Na+:H+ antiporter subunit E
MLLKRLVLSVPLAIGWTIYTAQLNIGNIMLGYIFSFVVLVAVGVRGDSINLSNAPRQIFYLIAYILFLSYEVLISGLQVARITLMPSLPIDPGLININTQDEDENAVVSAISAHGITITPGELVVDFEETADDGVLMVVHSLTIKESSSDLDSDQTIRLQRIKGILGYD